MIHRETVGIDLGSHSAKVVRARRIGGRLMVRDAAWVHLPPDPSERSRILAAFLTDKGYDTVPCVLGLSGQELMLNVVERVAGDPRSVADIVALELERVEALTEQDTVADHVAFRCAGQRYILLAMARGAAVGRGAAVLSELGAEVEDIVPGSMALYRAVHELGHARLSGCTMCVDSGQSGAEVTVGRGNKVLFSRGLAGSMGAAAAPEADASLAGEVAACLESFHAAFPRAAFAVKRIVLSGGGALVPGVTEAIRKATGVETVTLGCWSRKLPVNEVERYGRAIGLAACGVRRGGAGISLLPPGLRESRILHWQRQYWLLSSLALIGLMLLIVAGTFVELRWNRDYLRLRQVELVGMQALERKLAVYERLNAGLDAQSGPFRAAVENAGILEVALSAIADSKHPDDWLSLLADADAYFNSMPAGAENRVGGFSQIILEGYTPVEDFSTVGTMIDDLRHANGIVDADLLGDERLRDDPERDARWADTGCSLFVIEMTVQMP